MNSQKNSSKSTIIKTDHAHPRLAEEIPNSHLNKSSIPIEIPELLEQASSSGFGNSQLQLNTSEVTVTIAGFQFVPRSVYVHEGTRVRWIATRSDSVEKSTRASSAVYAHTGPRFFVVSVPALNEESDPIHEGNHHAADDAFSVLFSHVGHYEIICSNHTRMTAEIIVIESKFTAEQLLASIQAKEHMLLNSSPNSIMQQADEFKYPTKQSAVLKSNNKLNKQSNSSAIEITEKQQAVCLKSASNPSLKIAGIKQHKTQIVREELVEGQEEDEEDCEKGVTLDFMQEIKKQIEAEQGIANSTKRHSTANTHYLQLYKDDYKEDDDHDEPAKLPASLAAALASKNLLNSIQINAKGELLLETPPITPPDCSLASSTIHATVPANSAPRKYQVARKRSSSSSSGGSSERRRRQQLSVEGIDGYESDFYLYAASRTTRTRKPHDDRSSETSSNSSSVRIPAGLRKHMSAVTKNGGSSRRSAAGTAKPTESVSLNILHYKLAQRKLNGINAKSLLQSKKTASVSERSSQAQLQANNDHDDFDHEEDEEKNTDTGDEEENDMDDNADYEYNDSNYENHDENQSEEARNSSEDEHDEEDEEVEEDDEGNTLDDQQYQDENEFDHEAQPASHDHEGEDDIDNENENCDEDSCEDSDNYNCNVKVIENPDGHDHEAISSDANATGVQGCSESEFEESADSVQQQQQQQQSQNAQSHLFIEGNDYDCNQVISEEDPMNSSAQTSKDNSMLLSHSCGLRSRKQPNLNPKSKPNPSLRAATSSLVVEEKSSLIEKKRTSQQQVSQPLFDSSKQSRLKQQPQQQQLPISKPIKTSKLSSQHEKEARLGSSALTTAKSTRASAVKKSISIPKPIASSSILVAQKRVLATPATKVYASSIASRIPTASKSGSQSTSTKVSSVSTTNTSKPNSTAAISSSSSQTTSTTSSAQPRISAGNQVRGYQGKNMVGSSASVKTSGKIKSGNMSKTSQNNNNNNNNSMKSPAQSILTTAESSKYSDTTKNFSQKGDFELETSDIQEKEYCDMLLYRLRHFNKRRASTDQTIQESRSHGHDDSDTRSIKSLKNEPISLGASSVLSLNAAAAATTAALHNSTPIQQEQSNNSNGTAIESITTCVADAVQRSLHCDENSKIPTKSELEDSEQDGSLKIYEYDRFVGSHSAGLTGDDEGNEAKGEATRIGLREFCRIQPKDGIVIGLASSTKGEMRTGSEAEWNSYSKFASVVTGLLDMRYETERWLDDSLEDY